MANELELLRRPARDRDFIFTPAQLEIIEEDLDAQLFISGPPGSGKSETVIERCLHLIREGIDPTRLLILTFGRDHADFLRDEIATRANTVAREPLARTFSAFAFSIVRMSLAKTGLEPILLSGAEQDQLFRDFLAFDAKENKSGWPDAMRNALTTRGFAKELRDLISRAKEWGLDHQSLAQLAGEMKDDLWIAAAKFWSDFESYAERDHASQAGKLRIDPSELINRAVRALTDDPHFAKEVHGLFDVVIIDHFEESDPSHRRLLTALAPKAFAIFHDEASAVSRFRGADPEGLEAFLDRFADRKDVKRYTLTHVLRPSPIKRFIEADSVADESDSIATHLRSLHLRESIPWSEMAILVRSPGDHLAAIRRALIHAGIPVNQESGTTSLADNPVIRPILLIAEIALSLNSQEKFPATAQNLDAVEELLLSEFGGLDPLELRRIRNEINRSREEGDLTPAREILLHSLTDQEVIPDFDSENRLAQLRTLIRIAGDLARNKENKISEILWGIWSSAKDRDGRVIAEKWRERAIFSHSLYESGAADRDLDAMVELFEMAKRHVKRFPDAYPGKFIRELRKTQILGDVILPLGDRGERVTLSTVHSAKGKEWRIVVIAGLQEGRWPNLTLRGTLLGSERLVDIHRYDNRVRAELTAFAADSVAEDEARLFEIAKSRAKDQIIFTAVSRDDDEPSSYFESERGRARERNEESIEEITPFLGATAQIARLRREIIDSSTPPSRKEEVAALLKTLAEEGFADADARNWLGARKRTTDEPLVAEGAEVFVSPSEIDRFIECELRWFLEKSGARDGDSQAALLGSTIHAYAKLLADGAIDLTVAQNRLERTWHLIDLNTGWVHQAGLVDALRTLNRFFSWHSDNPRTVEATEAKFKFTIGRVVVSGSADRIEIDDDGARYIVDLKTSRSEITKDDAATNQQMAAYQAALASGAFEGIESGAKVAGAELVYPATDSVNVSIREQGPQPVDQTRATLTRVGEAMSGASFVARINTNCRICAVRSLCPMQGEGRSVIQ